jgi:predicted metal-dependent hydrolase
VQKRAAWNLRQQREFESYPPELPPRRYVSGESHPYLGKQYRLKVIEAEVDSVKLTSGRFLVRVRDNLVADQVKRLLDEWYRKQAQRVFAERLEACYPKIKRYGIPYPELSIRTMEKRWGSCSAEGHLILNLKLIQVPKPYIDYFILHELCHLKEHLHGPAL